MPQCGEIRRTGMQPGASWLDSPYRLIEISLMMPSDSWDDRSPGEGTGFRSAWKGFEQTGMLRKPQEGKGTCLNGGFCQLGRAFKERVQGCSEGVIRNCIGGSAIRLSKGHRGWALHPYVTRSLACLPLTN
jgi:hypothetical protein